MALFSWDGDWIEDEEVFDIDIFPCREGTAAAAAKSLQSCPTLCDAIDGSPPGSSVPGILQARTLEQVAISFSNAWKWKVKVKSLSKCPILCNPMDCSLAASSIHGIFQARVLEWVAIAFSSQSKFNMTSLGMWDRYQDVPTPKGHHLRVGTEYWQKSKGLRTPKGHHLRGGQNTDKNLRGSDEKVLKGHYFYHHCYNLH